MITDTLTILYFLFSLYLLSKKLESEEIQNTFNSVTEQYKNFGLFMICLCGMVALLILPITFTIKKIRQLCQK